MLVSNIKRTQHSECNIETHEYTPASVYTHHHHPSNDSRQIPLLCMVLQRAARGQLCTGSRVQHRRWHSHRSIGRTTVQMHTCTASWDSFAGTKVLYSQNNIYMKANIGKQRLMKPSISGFQLWSDKYVFWVFCCCPSSWHVIKLVSFYDKMLCIVIELSSVRCLCCLFLGIY